MHDKKPIYTSHKNNDDDWEIGTVASYTECTGLMPTPPLTDAEEDSYTDLYELPKPADRGKTKNKKKR